ncbi:hypothetical protein DFH09DRAFT_1091602 [Mycena vulgaris]|nr:hypothetical protein DFH09DRAFT_1091602 [Mycena vulgaris]
MSQSPAIMKGHQIGNEGNIVLVNVSKLGENFGYQFEDFMVKSYPHGGLHLVRMYIRALLVDDASELGNPEFLTFGSALPLRVPVQRRDAPPSDDKRDHVRGMIVIQSCRGAVCEKQAKYEACKPSETLHKSAKSQGKQLDSFSVGLISPTTYSRGTRPRPKHERMPAERLFGLRIMDVNLSRWAFLTSTKKKKKIAIRRAIRTTVLVLRKHGDTSPTAAVRRALCPMHIRCANPGKCTLFCAGVHLPQNNPFEDTFGHGESNPVLPIVANELNAVPRKSPDSGWRRNRRGK